MFYWKLVLWHYQIDLIGKNFSNLNLYLWLKQMGICCILHPPPSPSSLFSFVLGSNLTKIALMGIGCNDLKPSSRFKFVTNLKIYTWSEHMFLHGPIGPILHSKWTHFCTVVVADLFVKSLPGASLRIFSFLVPLITSWEYLSRLKDL